MPTPDDLQTAATNAVNERFDAMARQRFQDFIHDCIRIEQRRCRALTNVLAENTSFALYMVSQYGHPSPTSLL